MTDSDRNLASENSRLRIQFGKNLEEIENKNSLIASMAMEINQMKIKILDLETKLVVSQSRKKVACATTNVDLPHGC